MPTITDRDGNLHRPEPYATEADLEADVVRLSDQIFGSSTIYVDVKKRMVGHDVMGIPDGYVIDNTDVDSPKLYVVENELGKHDPLKHIGIQLLRFAVSFDDAKFKVRQYLMAEIAKRADLMGRLEQAVADSSFRNVDAYLDGAVYGPFRALVVIDEERPELHHVLGKVNANISVLTIQRYRSDQGAVLHCFDTLYDEDEVEVSAPAAQEELLSRADRRARLARADTIVVPAREEGFRNVFLGEDRWYAVRISAAMKERIRYIAAYQVAPISAVTHVAEVRDIKPYEDSGKYQLIFKGPASEIRHVPLGDPKMSPQGPVYVELEALMRAGKLEDSTAA